MVAWWRDRTLLLQEIDALRTDNQRAAIEIDADNDVKKAIQSMREEVHAATGIQSGYNSQMRNAFKESFSKLEAELENAHNKDND